MLPLVNLSDAVVGSAQMAKGRMNYIKRESPDSTVLS